MSKASELERLWREMRAMDLELKAEAFVCSKLGKKTKAYASLCRDMANLKTEYEKLKGGGTYNPMSLAHGEIATAKTAMGKMMGKMGPDSHAKLQE